MAGLLGFLAPAAPLAQAGLSFYGAKEAAKAAERESRRQYELDRLALQARPESVAPGWLSPPVFIGGAAALLLLIVLVARR